MVRPGRVSRRATPSHAEPHRDRPVERALPSLASAHAFAALLRTGSDRARRFGPAAVRIGYPTVDLGEFYIDAANRTMARLGVDVRLRTRAVRITVSDGRAGGVELSDSSTVAADAVVLAVPSWNLRALLDDVPGSEDARLAAKQLGAHSHHECLRAAGPAAGETVAPWESLLDSDIAGSSTAIGCMDHARRQPSLRADHLLELTT